MSYPEFERCAFQGKRWESEKRLEVSGKYKELLSSASPPASRKYPINVQEINQTISLTDEHAFSFITMPSVQLMQRAPFGHILISFQNISESPHNRRHGPIYFRTGEAFKFHSSDAT